MALRKINQCYPSYTQAKLLIPSNEYAITLSDFMQNSNEHRGLWSKQLVSVCYHQNSTNKSGNQATDLSRHSPVLLDWISPGLRLRVAQKGGSHWWLPGIGLWRHLTVELLLLLLMLEATWHYKFATLSKPRFHSSSQIKLPKGGYLNRHNVDFYGEISSTLFRELFGYTKIVRVSSD